MMLALEMSKLAPEELIGRVILTEGFGDWPGGAAVITELSPDPSAPEIVFNVKLVIPAYGPSRSEFYDYDMGVFEFEKVSFVELLEHHASLP